MAKRTKLTAPSAEDLAQLDAEFRSENPPRPNPATAPIAQVAAESAALGSGEATEQRLNRADAERLRAAEEQGLLIAEIPTSQIVDDTMVRDRSILDADQMTELKLSLRTTGQRLPIEVFPIEGGQYALISGYRRLMATRDLAEMNPGDFKTIKAIVRAATDTAEAFAAMVEENEIRADLSPYERGRIAVIASQQGAFDTTEAAIIRLFKNASAAKRSKVKSFAEVFEMLGDMLQFPETLTERRGLRLAGALRQGAEQRLRLALEGGEGTTPDLEWAVLEQVISEVEEGPVKVAKRGRPKSTPDYGWVNADTMNLPNGVTLRKGHDGDAFVIRLSGKLVTEELVSSAMEHLRHLFGPPD